MQAPSREELLAGTADAEQVLDPGSWWHYSNLAFALLGEVVARAHGGTWEDALQANILDPLGLARTTPDGGRPGRARLLRPALQRRRPARARARSRRRRRARQALVDDGRPRDVGSLPRRRRRPRPEGVDARGDGTRSRDGRPRGLEARLGHGARALPLRRPRLRRPRRRDARPPRRSRRQPQDEDRRGRAHEHGRRRLAGEARARPRRRGDRGAARGGRGVAARRDGAAGDRAAARPLVGRRARRWCSRGGRAGSRRSSSTALPGATRRSSRPTARTASAASRAASAASCCASCGTRTARSRSSTSRRIRCAASRRRSTRSPAKKNAAAMPDVDDDQDHALQPARAPVREQERRDHDGHAERDDLHLAERQRQRLDQQREERDRRDQEDRHLRARREGDLRRQLDLAPGGDDDCAAVLGGVPDDRDHHRGEEELADAGVVRERVDRPDEDLGDERRHHRRERRARRARAEATSP